MNKTIIKVQFPDKYREGEFCKMEYTYYLDAGLAVEPGQIITVPTKFGHTNARVSKINLSEGAIDMRWAKDMRTITAADLEAAPRPAEAHNQQSTRAQADQSDFFYEAVSEL
jgi:hypothetical protein